MEELRLYRDMLRIRRFEEKCAEVYSAGFIRGFLHLYIGEEAVEVGAMAALRPDDAIVATYREHGHALAKEPVPKPPRTALGAPGGVPPGRREERSGSTRFEPDAVEGRPPPQPGGTTPGGRSAASRPLNDEPHRPAGLSLQSIPPDDVAARGGFGTGSLACP